MANWSQNGHLQHRSNTSILVNFVVGTMLAMLGATEATEIKN